ncbi:MULTISPECIES: RNA-binding protein [Methanohalophilus]|uniref:RNA-binding protein n=1 Tax=Methanohalophilus TaxID=2175 RepID=UPI0013E8D84A|nr:MULTISPECIES: RNA-binding protein [Methanohalophilus]
MRVTAHATEDRDRVISALKFLLPDVIRNSSDIDEQINSMVVEGHYGNLMALYSLDFKRKAETSALMNRLVSELSKSQRDELFRQLDERLDDQLMLHLRFSKQEAYSGKLVTESSSDAIAVKIKIATYPKDRNKALEMLEDFFEQI